MSYRVKQINEQLLSELAMLVRENVIMKEGLITLTSAHASPDLRYAKIFISVMPEKFTGTALSLLRKNNVLFRKELTERLSLKFIPKLVWAVDEKIRYSMAIDEVLRQIREEDEKTD
jgi:ribosome-binding factor A